MKNFIKVNGPETGEGKDEKQDLFFFYRRGNENIARTKKYIYILGRQIKKLSGSFYPLP